MLGHRRAVIYANDTDITILSMYHLSVNMSLDELWICRNGVHVPVHLHVLVENLAAEHSASPRYLCSVLLAGYTLGC